MPAANDLEIVRRINVLRGLNPLRVERLIAPAVVMSLLEGETVFRQGDLANAFFIVIEGWVKLYRIAMSGEEAVISLFGKGDCFAEAVAFAGQPYPATAETVSKARIVRIPASHDIKCIRAMPDIALAMIASTSRAPASPGLSSRAAQGANRRAASSPNSSSRSPPSITAAARLRCLTIRR